MAKDYSSSPTINAALLEFDKEPTMVRYFDRSTSLIEAAKNSVWDSWSITWGKVDKAFILNDMSICPPWAN